MNTDWLIERRNRAMGPTYRLFYQQPVHLVRGVGTWLYGSDVFLVGQASLQSFFAIA